MTEHIYILALAALALLLISCQHVQPTMVKIGISANIKAIAVERLSDNPAAARQYVDLAHSTSGIKQAQFFLFAARAYLQINHLDHVVEILGYINKELFNKIQLLDVAIIEAKIALSMLQSELALASLASHELKYALPYQQQIAYIIKLEAYERTGQWLKKANTHINLEALLSNNRSIFDNQEALWQTLIRLTPQVLKSYNMSASHSANRGWFSLAYVIRVYKKTPESLILAIENWQRNYPNHPADISFYKRQLEMGTGFPRKLNDIAILLPELGPYSIAAEAIIQGIIAAHFDGRTTIRLHFLPIEIDLATGTSNVLQQYQEAISNNVNLVIGPLSKISVQVLADTKELPIPVLALNSLNNQQAKNDNLFQFGLAPEDDAIAAADFAIKQGHERAVVLAPSGNWGNRVANAFSDQWLINGGTLVQQAQYDGGQSNFSAVITSLVCLDTSQQRQLILRQILGKSIEFEPRRRQDIDFLFLVAHPLQARQLLPQLRFHRSGLLPIIATSHAYSGQENSRRDIDLNDLIINDIPWVFNDLAILDSTYTTLKNSSQHQFDHAIRFYALGADAYRLISNMNKLSRSPDLDFMGATGLLSIDEIGNLKRRTYWAKFHHGKIRALVPGEGVLPSFGKTIK